MVSRDALVNVVILVTCGVVAGLALEQRFYGRAAAAVAAPIVAPAIGKPAEILEDVGYADAERSYILYVRSTCQYCTASMPFYRQFAQALNSHRGARLVMASYESKATTAAYLAEQGLFGPSITITRTKAPGPTPVLVLVDRHGIVQNAWVGQQDASGERAILASLSANQ